MNRGDRREPIFKDDADRQRFVETLGECCGKTDWQVHAFCLMPNHFHLVIETPQANLVAGMKWCLGDKGFRKELLAQMADRVGPSHYGAERQESGEEKAEGIVAEELQRRRWTEADLAGRRKGDGEKVRVAVRLRRETIMTLRWIAERLHMGSWTHVSNCLAAT